jgi:hypothetical protein
MKKKIVRRGSRRRILYGFGPNVHCELHETIFMRRASDGLGRLPVGFHFVEREVV